MKGNGHRNVFSNGLQPAFSNEPAVFPASIASFDSLVMSGLGRAGNQTGSGTPLGSRP